MSRLELLAGRARGPSPLSSARSSRIARLAIPALLLALALAAQGCGYALLGVAAGAASGGGGGGGGGGGVVVNDDTEAEILDSPRVEGPIQPVRIRVADPQGDAVSFRLEVRAGGAGAAFVTATLTAVRDASGATTIRSGALDDTGPLAGAPGGVEYLLDWPWQALLGTAPVEGVTLRLSIVGTGGGPGRAAFTAPPRTIGNDRPVVSALSVTGGSGTLVVKLRVRDSTGDACDVRVRAIVDGGAPATITAVVGTLEGITNTAQNPEVPFLWETRAEPFLGDDARANVVLEVTAVETETGVAGDAVQSLAFTLLNDLPPSARIASAPARAASGDVRLEVDLADPEGDAATLDARWRLLSGALPSGATTGALTLSAGSGAVGSLVSLAATPAGERHVLLWNAAADLGTGTARRVAIDVVPLGIGAAGDSSPPIEVGNDPPLARFLAAVPAGAGGDVAVAFSLEDGSRDPTFAVLLVSVAGGPFLPATVSGTASGLLPGPRGAPAAFGLTWRSAADLPQASLTPVTLRLRASDGLPEGEGAPAVTTTAITNASLAAPAISAIVPAGGRPEGGTDVVVLGSGFAAGGVTAEVGGLALDALLVLDDGTLRGRTRAHAAGAADLVVRTLGGAVTRTAAFRYQTAPVVSSVAPAEGPAAGGTSVTIHGAGFVLAGGATATATIGGAPLAALAVLDDQTITGRTPAGATGAASVVVATADGEGALSGGFRYAGVPSLAAVTPTAGPLAGGTALRLSGAGFLATSVTVTVGGVAAAEVVLLSDGAVQATLPARASPGTVAVAIETPGGLSTLAGAFTYLAAPSIVTVTPSRGALAGGASIAISGAGFVPGDTVALVGGVPLGGPGGVSATAVTGVAPALPTGTYDVVVRTAGGEARALRAYRAVAAPAIAAVTPAGGPPSGGTLVTIAGAGFLAGETSVLVGGASLTALEVLSEGALRGRTPPGAAGGATVAVSTPFGSAARPLGFSYQDAPVLTSLSPPEGALGAPTPLVIHGAGLGGATRATLGGATVTGLAVLDADTLAGLAPTSLAKGAHDLAVTAPGGSAALAGAFTVLGAPSVLAVAPPSGPAAGGTPVTVSGTGFLARAVTCTVDGGALVDLVVIDDAHLSGRTPTPSALAPGTFHRAVAVAVVTAGGTASLAGSFTYLAPPAVVSVSPPSGSTAGGEALTISGTALHPPIGSVLVRVGGVAASVTSIPDALTIVAIAPPRGPGPASVEVETAGGVGTLTAGYTYVTPTGGGGGPGALSIAAVSPDFGVARGDTEIVLVGDGFVAGGTSVSIGGRACDEVVVLGPTVLTARTPPGVVGAQDVTAVTSAPPASATRAAGFRYAPSLSFDALAQVVLGETATRAVAVRLSLGPGVLPSPVGADLVVDSGTTALLGADFSLPGVSRVLFDAGAHDGETRLALVSFSDDRIPETDESVVVRLASPSGGAILESPIAHSVGILDDDPRVTTVTATRLGAPAPRAAVGAAVDVAWQRQGAALLSVTFSLPDGALVSGTSNVVSRTPFPTPSATATLAPAAPLGVRVLRVTGGVQGDETELSEATWMAQIALATPQFRVVAELPDGEVVFTLQLAASSTERIGALPGLTFPGTLSDDIVIARARRDRSIRWWTRLPRTTGAKALLGAGVISGAGGRVAIVCHAQTAVSIESTGEITGAVTTTTTAFLTAPALTGPEPFIVLLDLQTGRPLRVRKFVEIASTFNSAQVRALAPLPDGGFAIAGQFGSDSEPIRLGGTDPGAVTLTTETLVARVFVSRWSPRGDLVTATAVTSAPGPGGSAALGSLTALPDGSLAICGSGSSLTSFGPVLLSAVSAQQFLGVIGPDDAFRWVATLANPGTPRVAPLPGGGLVAAFTGGAVTVRPGTGNSFVVNPGATSEVMAVGFSAAGQLRFTLSSSGNSASTIVSADPTPDGGFTITGSCPLSGLTFSTILRSKTLSGGAGGAGQLFQAHFDQGGIFQFAQGAGLGATVNVDAAAPTPEGGVIVSGRFNANPCAFGESDERAVTLASQVGLATLSRNCFFARWAPMNTRFVSERPLGFAYAALATTPGGLGGSEVAGVDATRDGGVVVAGSFMGEETFASALGATPSATLAQSSLNDVGAYVARYDTAGRLLWANPIEGEPLLPARGLAVAAMPDGGAVVAGTFSFLATLADTASASALVLAPKDGGFNDDIFVARYGPTGRLLWARSAGSSGQDHPSTLSVLPGGRIVVAGDAGTTGMVFGEAGEPTATTLTGRAFVAVYAPDGALVSVRGYGDFFTGDAFLARAAAGADGSIAVAAAFQGKLTFGAGEPGVTTLTSSPAGRSSFVALYTPTGTVAWVRGLSSDSEALVQSVAVANDGDVAIGGYFGLGLRFSLVAGGPTTLTSAPGSFPLDADAFAARLAGASGALRWARRAGGTQDDGCAAVRVRGDGSVLLAGHFKGTATFGPGEARATALTSAGGADLFLALISASGDLVEARHAAGSPEDDGASSQGGTALGLAALSDGSAFLGSHLAPGEGRFGRGEPNETPVTVEPGGGGHAFLGRFFPGE